MNCRALRGFFPSPRQEQLLRAALLRTPEAATAWREWASGIDWENDHPDRGSFALLPFVYKNLSSLRVDDPLMNRLKGIYRYTWSRNVQVLQQHLDILQCLHDSDTRALLLDDFAMSTPGGPGAGVVPVSGLDVLVPGSDVRRVLADLAARSWLPEQPLTGKRLLLGHAVRMLNGPGRSFRLHWHVVPECVSPAADEPFPGRALSTEILGVPALVLSPADALLRAIVRGIGPNPVPPMQWVTNAALITNAGGTNMQWQKLQETAERLKLNLRLAQGLQYLHTILPQHGFDNAIRQPGNCSHSCVERIEYHLLGRDNGRWFSPVFGRCRTVLVRCLRLTVACRPGRIAGGSSRRSQVG